MSEHFSTTLGMNVYSWLYATFRLRNFWEAVLCFRLGVVFHHNHGISKEGMDVNIYGMDDRGKTILSY